MTLLICPVRPGDSNPELLYALRSWQTNLIMPDLTLITVGHKPAWLEPDIHVEGNRHKSVPLAVFDNIYLASQHCAATGAGDETAIYMNDDFFCLDPTPGVVPVKRNMTLAEHCAISGPGNGTWWPRSLALTASWLAEQGYPSPDSYDLHRPLSARPWDMLYALDRWIDSRPDSMKGDIPQWRTIYGVLNEIEAYPVADAKLSARVNGYGTPWISTSDNSWRLYMGEIKKRFQKPSRWEI